MWLSEICEIARSITFSKVGSDSYSNDIDWFGKYFAYFVDNFFFSYSLIYWWILLVFPLLFRNIFSIRIWHSIDVIRVNSAIGKCSTRHTKSAFRYVSSIYGHVQLYAPESLHSRADRKAWLRKNIWINCIGGIDTNIYVYSYVNYFKLFCFESLKLGVNWILSVFGQIFSRIYKGWILWIREVKSD